MSDYYTVEQGDHLSSIAKDNGFTDYTIIWNHPKNADLKNKRQNPNILFPGDEIFIPDMEEKQESGATDKRHTFKVDKKPLFLRLVLEDLYEKPIGGAQCALRISDQVTQPTTTAEGKIQQEIPLDAHDAFLVIRGDQTPFADTLITFKIGDLDPIDEQSGQIARLNNLGYFAGAIDGSDDTAFESAVEEFQCDHGLTVDGDCGPKTQAKLKLAHGS
jgi:Putative peptidoglycan binding domain/LysM domain